MINKVITSAKAALRRLKSKKGQTLVEYALILGVVAVLTIGVLQALGVSVSGVLNRVSTSISAVPNP